MPIYYCKVLSKDGRTSELIREATSEDVLIGELNREAVYPIEIKEAQGGERKLHRRKFSRASILEFTNTVALLLSSGLTFKDALEIAQTIFLKGEVNEIIVWLLEEVRKGRSLSQTLDDFGASFPPIFRGLIKIGEKIGSLEGSFKQLAQYLAEERKLAGKLGSSLIYPVLVLSVAILGVTGIVLFVFPRIAAMFAELGSALPPRLESVIALLRVSAILGVIIGGLVAASPLILSMIRRREGPWAVRVDRLVLKLPVIGSMRYLREILNLLFAMETLTEGGFTVEDALLESSRVVSNRSFRSGILEARERILKGENLSAALLENPLFAERLGKWVAVGERSGQVGRVFAQLRRYYQGEIERWSTRFMSLVEPVLILVVGIFLFFIIIFFVTPIFSIYQGLM